MAIEAKIVGVWPAPVRPPTVGPKPRVNNWPAGLQPVQHPPVDPATAYRTAAWIDPDAPKTGIWTPPGQRPDPPAGGGAGGRVEGDDKRLALAEEEKGFFDDFKPFGEDGFTFFDFLDIINPLQHVPIVGNIYRNLTGDTIDPASRLAGSTLFWGPIGTAVAAVNVALSYATGKDLAEHAFSIFVDPTDGGGRPGDRRGDDWFGVAPARGPIGCERPRKTARGSDSGGAAGGGLRPHRDCPSKPCRPRSSRRCNWASPFGMRARLRSGRARRPRGPTRLTPRSSAPVGPPMPPTLSPTWAGGSWPRKAVPHHRRSRCPDPRRPAGAGFPRRCWMRSPNMRKPPECLGTPPFQEST